MSAEHSTAQPLTGLSLAEVKGVMLLHSIRGTQSQRKRFSQSFTVEQLQN